MPSTFGPKLRSDVPDSKLDVPWNNDLKAPPKKSYIVYILGVFAMTGPPCSNSGLQDGEWRFRFGPHVPAEPVRSAVEFMRLSPNAFLIYSDLL